MQNKIHDAFASVKAPESLKTQTMAFLAQSQEKPVRRITHPVRLVMASLLLLFLLLGGAAFYLYKAPVSYISIDINPSIELALNRFEQVVDVTGYNRESDEILNSISLKNKSYTDAINLLLNDPAFDRYLNSDNLLTFTVISDQEETIVDGIRRCTDEAKVNAQCHNASEQILPEAHHSGMSFGKYQAYLQLSEYDPDITVEDCKRMNMHELRNRLSQYTQTPEGDLNADCSSEEQSECNSSQHGHNANANGNGNGNGQQKRQGNHWDS